MFLILGWTGNYKNLAIVTDAEGEPKLFKTYKEALNYAKENLTWNWNVVKIT